MVQELVKVHPEFRFNGIHFSESELAEVAYSLIKEGEDFEIAIGDFILDWLSDSDEIAVKTSGSTGAPKNIYLKKQHMVNSAMATASFFELKPGHTVLLCLPANYIAGKMMLVRAMILGLDIDCIRPESNPLAHTGKSYEFVAMVPLQLTNSLGQLNRVKKLLVGGAPLGDRIKEALDKEGTLVYESYGMTETITHIALKKVNHNLPGTVAAFETLPGVKISKDNRGCLVIEAPGISSSRVITNDLVELTTESSFQWLGRFDNVINSGGVKLIPEQIERKLKSILENRFFAYGVPDDKLGTKLVLFVEGETDVKKLMSDIKLLKTLSKYEVPKEILQLSVFEETPAGKLDRAKTAKLKTT
ncbi:AMP-binding protein [Poritiphilus flavus]|uniref:AMP-binding protein n=1 Tax=Poritiphilus flavus TaxID=2697053 RepID=A0A6L9EFB1_9FLAO|nr:AMP-binding protein [Poritiphilus flavus]NAS13454.1 AMP-binding protein [Poritiphilus flavus]